MIKVIIGIDTDQIVEIGECHLDIELNVDRIIEEGHNMLTIIEMTLGEEIVGRTQNYRGKNFRGVYRGNYRDDDFGTGRSRSRERQYLNNFRRNDQSSSSRLRSGLRVSINRDRI